MKFWKRLVVWWRGVQPNCTETEGGGWLLEGQDPEHPPARDRLAAATRNPLVTWFGSRMDRIIIAVITVAILTWLGFR